MFKDKQKAFFSTNVFDGVSFQLDLTPWGSCVIPSARTNAATGE